MVKEKTLAELCKEWYLETWGIDLMDEHDANHLLDLHKNYINWVFAGFGK
jgi:hypothetical protein